MPTRSPDGCRRSLRSSSATRPDASSLTFRRLLLGGPSERLEIDRWFRPPRGLPPRGGPPVRKSGFCSCGRVPRERLPWKPPFGPLAPLPLPSLLVLPLALPSLDLPSRDVLPWPRGFSDRPRSDRASPSGAPSGLRSCGLPRRCGPRPRSERRSAPWLRGPGSEPRPRPLPERCCRGLRFDRFPSLPSLISLPRSTRRPHGLHA